MAALTSPRVVLVAGTLSLSACATHSADVRAVQHGLDAKTLSAFDQAYEGGKAQLMSDHVGLALVLFEKALAIDPKSVAALNAVGTAYDELHFPQIAARYYTRALALEPNSADTLNNMALSARIAGKPEEARILFERALAADAANRTIQANLGAIDAPVQTAAAPSEETGPSDAPVIEQVGQDAFTIVIQPQAALSSRRISVEPLPAPAAVPARAEASPHEQSMRVQVAAFFAERDERRQLAAAESDVSGASLQVASEASSPVRRSYVERRWFSLFRAFFEQREAKQPRDDRKDASSRGAHNG
jgi:tetratricopeptide (TPR) repeat protein